MYITQKVRRFLTCFFSVTLSSDASERFELECLLGFKPRHISIYKLAFKSKQMDDGVADNNERLEFLGDAILACSVTSYLFKQYPYQGEHFMTEMRSKIVNREMLNSIAKYMGIDKMLARSHGLRNVKIETSDIYGNTLEALVGAIMIDQGYGKVDWWIREQMLKNYVNIKKLENIDINVKNKLLSWAAQCNKKVEFVVDNVALVRDKKVFTTSVKIDEYTVAKAQGTSKKESSLLACQLAVKELNI